MDLNNQINCQAFKSSKKPELYSNGGKTGQGIYILSNVFSVLLAQKPTGHQQ